MTPEAEVDIRDAAIDVTWQGKAFSGRARVRLTAQNLLLDVAGTGKAIRLGYDGLRGADLRAGVLTIWAREGEIAVRPASRPDLEVAWNTLSARACELPELTVGLRALGSRHGGDPEAQRRFFAPLLSARRRLEEQPELPLRLAAFDAVELETKLLGALRELVAECTTSSAAARRSLEAQALDEADGLRRALQSLGRAAEALREGDDAERFVRWRDWAAQARLVFTEADRCWLAVWPLLEDQSHGRPRKGRRGGSSPAVAFWAILATLTPAVVR